MKPATKKIRHEAFTLIEIMIVVAIIGLMAAISAPSPAGHAAKGRDAQGGG